MFKFSNDYREGAHESILDFLYKINREQLTGYSCDIYSDHAREIISKLAGNCPKENIHFLNGGTQTNTAVITAFLRPHQGVISSDIGHINTHEAGAIEGTGHKIIALSSKNGKIDAAQIREIIEAHENDPTATHTVQPGMVYISQPTEIGTVYTKKELENLSSICRKHKIPLYVDGARLGCALTAKTSDFTIEDLAGLTDAFYIGGTKNGAFIGETLIIPNSLLNKDFSYIHKQRGGRLAKGWLIGAQFLCLFKNDLFFVLAKHANDMAGFLSRELEKMGFSFLALPETNQVFPVFPLSLVKELEKKYVFHRWEKIDNENISIRLCTSWATEKEAIDTFLSSVRNMKIH